MEKITGIEDRFTVEKCDHKGLGVGDFAIRFTPPVRHHAREKTMGLSFQALIAGDVLGNQEDVLNEVATLLNQSDVGLTDEQVEYRVAQDEEPKKGGA